MTLHLSELGVRGDTSEMIAARWDEVDRRVCAWPGTRVVCQFGANDVMRPDGIDRVDADGTLRALRTMVDRTAPDDLLVVGPPVFACDDDNARLSARSVVIAEGCAELGVPFVPMHDRLRADPVWREAVARGDGAHPDSVGWVRYAEIVGPPVLDWLSAPR